MDSKEFDGILEETEHTIGNLRERHSILEEAAKLAKAELEKRETLLTALTRLKSPPDEDPGKHKTAYFLPNQSRKMRSSQQINFHYTNLAQHVTIPNLL